jgi:uncharacterized membrane protein YjfL (UPF0719 family)
MTSNLALSAGFWSLLGDGVWAIALYAVLGLLLMVVGFFAIDFTTPGKLRELVPEGKPNAVVVASAGFVSMALIVVIAEYAAAGRLTEGLISAAIYGLVGIAAQTIAVRAVELILRIDVKELLEAPEYRPVALVVAAASFAFGLVVAFAIL